MVKQKITAITDITSPTDQIVLGIIKTGPDSGPTPGMLQTDWTLDTIASVAGVIDLRPTYLLRINHELLDDTKLIFKDRDSWGTSFADIKLQTDELKATEIESTGDVIVGDDLDVTGISTLLTDQGSVRVKSTTANNAAIGFYRDSESRGALSMYSEGTSGPHRMRLHVPTVGVYDQAFFYFSHGATGGQIGINTLPMPQAWPDGDIDFHIFKEGTMTYPTIRLEASSTTGGNETIYDMYGRNDDEDSDAALIFQPRDNNRPVQFLNKTGTLNFEIDTLSKAQYFHIIYDLTVGGQAAVTGNTTVGGTLTATGASSLQGAVSAASTLNVAGATTLSTATVSTLTVSDLVQVSTDGT